MGSEAFLLKLLKIRSKDKEILMDIVKKELLKKIACCSALAFSFSISADQEITRGSAESRAEEVARSYSRNSISYSSKDTLENLPPHVLYSAIFRRLVLSPDLFQEFGKTDIEKIATLPSERDAQLLGPQIMAMKATCYVLGETEEFGNSFHRSLALYIKTIRENERILDAHYLEFLHSLSDEANAHIESLKFEMTGRNQLVYSTVDLEGIGADVPDYVEELMRTRCTEILLLDIDELPSGLTLMEETTDPENMLRIDTQTARR
jgi:hypothetical protein